MVGAVFSRRRRLLFVGMTQDFKSAGVAAMCTFMRIGHCSDQRRLITTIFIAMKSMNAMGNCPNLI
jgi:hypothetical protein